MDLTTEWDFRSSDAYHRKLHVNHVLPTSESVAVEWSFAENVGQSEESRGVHV